MSEPKLISPMLDAFEMGGPISDHDGVRCCPAMKKGTDDKYIVKIISVPASKTKLDALLLTGAYPDLESALAYFKDVADDVSEEKKVLDDLARLGGFVPYEDSQIVLKDDGSGYDVYLLAPYRMTLERKISRTPLTQLEAVNLGLDLCSAMAICRQSGFMCVDLKPANIVVTAENGFCIGDIGFTRLSGLQYASLADKYRSRYTAPEVEDAFSLLNATLDIYSVGMILYQIYNDGKLPAHGEEIPAPIFADEEISQIIMKAIAPDPADRWQDPVQMGQALVSYMQKNGVNETPLTNEFFGTQQVDEQPEMETADEEVVTPLTTDEEIIPQVIPGDEIPADVSDSETPDISDSSDLVVDEQEDATLEKSETVDVAPEITEETTTSPESEITDTSEEDFDNLSFLEDEELDVDYDAVPADVSDMLDQIDELAAHQIPEPPVAPDPIEVTLPEPEPAEDQEPDAEEEAADEDPSDEAEAGNEEEDTEEEKAESTEPEPVPEEQMPYVPKKKRTGLVWCIVILLIAALGVGAYFFYNEYYLQPIHTLDLLGAEDRLQVTLTADIDESYLTVICADSHGNRIPAPVVGGTAVFTGLAPDTAYTVSVEVEGIHKLTGTTSKVYSTPIQTKIAQINAITGSERGSVILSFAIEGPDSDQWNVIYSADGEAERVTAFAAHMVTLTGLTVGKEYTFRLEAVDDIFLSGATEITYVAKDLVYAENLRITACTGGILTAEWNTPSGSDISQWTVRCFNENGYDERITTDGNSATFENIDETSSYTVDVTAEFMSVNQRVVVSANSITVSDFVVDASRSDVLTLSWNANRETPAEGWTLQYSIDGVNAVQSLTVNSNTVQVPALPGEYQFSILDGAGNAVLGGPFVHVQGEATAFDAFSVQADDLTVRLCNRPSDASWSYKDLEDDDYVNSFPVGQKVSAVVALSGSTSTSDDTVVTTFAIYDETDNLVSFSHISQTWRSMWYENYCELNIPAVPAQQGTYNLVLMFNGQIAGSQKFMITA